MLIRSELETPVGPLTLITTDRAVILCECSDNPDRINRYLTKHFAGVKTSKMGANDVFHNEVLMKLKSYFAGYATALEGIRTDARGSEFDKRIWQALRTIPAGVTWSYGDLAEAAESHPRAVGGANGRNPIALITPCHRVIGKDGSLTGYAGGVARKQWLLEMEGAIKSLL